MSQPIHLVKLLKAKYSVQKLGCTLSGSGKLKSKILLVLKALFDGLSQ